MKSSKIVNVQPILPKIYTHNAWTYPMECAKNWTDPKNVTYVSMATKIPIIKHREFFHISMCYISVINEHISSKCTPVMHRNMGNSQKSNYLEISSSHFFRLRFNEDQRQTHNKTMKIIVAAITFEPEVVCNFCL